MDCIDGWVSGWYPLDCYDYKRTCGTNKWLAIGHVGKTLEFRGFLSTAEFCKVDAWAGWKTWDVGSWVVRLGHAEMWRCYTSQSRSPTFTSPLSPCLLLSLCSTNTFCYQGAQFSLSSVPHCDSYNYHVYGSTFVFSDEKESKKSHLKLKSCLYKAEFYFLDLGDLTQGKMTQE